MFRGLNRVVYWASSILSSNIHCLVALSYVSHNAEDCIFLIQCIAVRTLSWNSYDATFVDWIT